MTATEPIELSVGIEGMTCAACATRLQKACEEARRRAIGEREQAIEKKAHEARLSLIRREREHTIARRGPQSAANLCVGICGESRKSRCARGGGL